MGNSGATILGPYSTSIEKNSRPQGFDGRGEGNWTQKKPVKGQPPNFNIKTTRDAATKSGKKDRKMQSGKRRSGLLPEGQGTAKKRLKESGPIGKSPKIPKEDQLRTVGVGEESHTQAFYKSPSN